MKVRVELVHTGEREVFANLDLAIVPEVGEWLIRSGAGDGGEWRESYSGLRCYQVSVRRFFSDGRVRLVVCRGRQYEELMREELVE